MGVRWVSDTHLTPRHFLTVDLPLGCAIISASRRRLTKKGQPEGVNMRRTITWVMALGSVAIGITAITTRVTGQIYLGAAPPQGTWASQPTTKDGEWPSYNADIRGTRY